MGIWSETFLLGRRPDHGMAQWFLDLGAVEPQNSTTAGFQVFCAAGDGPKDRLSTILLGSHHQPSPVHRRRCKTIECHPSTKALDHARDLINIRFAFQKAYALHAIANRSEFAAGLAVASSPEIEPETVEAGMRQLVRTVHVHAMVSEQMIRFAGDE